MLEGYVPPCTVLWETSEVTTAAKAVGHLPVMYLHPRIRHCRNLQQLPQVLQQPRLPGLPRPWTQILLRGRNDQQQNLWETSEVTTAAKAVGHLPVMYLHPRIRHCRNLQQLPQVLQQPRLPGLLRPWTQILLRGRNDQQQKLWETSEVTRAANAVVHSPKMPLIHRIRPNAARSKPAHRDLVF
jgi:hypothetical protein